MLFHLFSAILAKDWESLFLKFCPEMTGSFDKKAIETEVLCMGHRFTYVVSPEEERENLTVEWFLRRHGYSRHIITGLKRTEDGIFRNGVRAWTSQAVHAGM
mgnify:FL=1